MQHNRGSVDSIILLTSQIKNSQECPIYTIPTRTRTVRFKAFVGFTDIINLVKDLTDPIPIMIRDIIRISEMTK